MCGGCFSEQPLFLCCMVVMLVDGTSNCVKKSRLYLHTHLFPELYGLVLWFKKVLRFSRICFFRHSEGGLPTVRVLLSETKK
jgi:hypothetical protein